MISQFFQEFVKMCFDGDLRTCELRLSEEEKEYVSKNYSSVTFHPLEGVDNADGKIWYEVIIG